MCVVMRLRTPPKNKMYNNTIFYKDAFSKLEEVYNKLEDFEYVYILNDLFDQIEFKIDKIKYKIIYEILEIEQNPKQYRRTLERSKQL